MSCGNGNGCGPAYVSANQTGSLPPCQPSSVAQESTGSQIENLTTQLFGPVTKTVTAGRFVWSQPCTANTNGLPGLPIQSGEGFICYLLRVMTQIGLFMGGIWSPGVTYNPQTVVAYGASLYVALRVNAGITPGTDPTAWMLLLTAPTGAQGAQGVPGPSGGSGTPAYGTRVTSANTTLEDSDDAIICTNTSAITLTVDAGSGLTSGKRFLIKQARGAAQVTIAMTGSDTLEGAATYILSTPGESITIVQNGTTGVWYIF